jgi:pimeloyl-ACP methyl ester carboxylesterase
MAAKRRADPAAAAARHLSNRSFAMPDMHQTAPTRFAEANGIRFAYRRFGKTGTVPLVMNLHFRGTMDHWDPAITDGLARYREVILFDNAGVGASSGKTPANFLDVAGDSIAFIKALGIAKTDIMGYSIGGKVAQEIVVQAPELVRRLILAGTGPRGADTATSKSAEIFSATYDPPEHLWIAAHFGPSSTSRAAGFAYLERKHRRRDRSPEVSEASAAAQMQAIITSNEKTEGVWDYLAHIPHPTLVVHGSDDLVIPTVNGFTLQQHLPNAQLIIYPDSSHAPMYQYPELFLAHANLFLDAGFETLDGVTGGQPFPTLPSIPPD